MLWPKGPSVAASASLLLLNIKGKSHTANSLTWLAKMPEFMVTISSVPPCRAETLAWSLPSVPPGNRLTLSWPPDLASTKSLNFSMPMTNGWPLGFWVANLMVLVWADATPTQARATLATKVLRNRRFMMLSPVKKFQTL